MSARFCVLLLAVLFAAHSSYAAITPLSLDEAIQTALLQNKDVEIARLSVEKADAQAREAIGNALPNVSLFGNYNHNIQIPAFFFPAGPDGEFQVVRAGLENSYQAGAQINQILFNSAVFTGIGAAGIYQDAARELYSAAVATVVTETKKRYYLTLAANELLAISEATLKNAQQNFETIEALFDEGLVAEFDKIRASVIRDNIRPQVTQSKADYNNAVSALMTYLAMDIADTVLPTTTDLGPPLPVPDESAALAAAMANNYDLKALALQLNVLDEIIVLERSTYYPTLTAVGQWQNQGQSNDVMSNYLTVTSSFVGLNLSFNIFNGGKTLAKVQQAKVDYLTAREQYENFKNIVKLQVRTVINDIRSAIERIDALQSTVEQAQRGFEISRVRYTEGTGNLLEVNDSEVALARAQVNRLQALFDYYRRHADYDRVIGNIPDQFLKYKED